nr:MULTISPECIES: hypothetical protein [unclassified Mesorhizobium]
MSKKARVILTMVIIEAVLAGIWWYLADYGMTNPDRVKPDFQAVVGQTMGMAMAGCWASASFCFSSPRATNARHSRARHHRALSASPRIIHPDRGDNVRFRVAGTVTTLLPTD